MKKILALMLSVMMVVCMMPSMAFAEETSGEESTTPGQTEQKVPLTENNVTGIVDKTYTGSSITQSITIDGAAVTDTDFAVAYENNTDASTDNQTATVTITPTETNTTYNTTPLTLKFTINKANLSACKVTIPDQEIGQNLNWNDTNIKVTFNGIDVKSQCKISGAPPVTSAGGNSITLEPSENSNFTGTVNASYYGANLLTSSKYTVEVSGNKPSVVYTGAPQTVSGSYYRVKINSTGQYLSASYYDVSFKNNTDVGNATVVITGKNGYSGTLELQNAFAITQRNIATYCTFSGIENQIQDQAVDITVKDGSKTLKLNTDYGIKTTSAGYITVYGINNYGGEKTFSVKYGASILNADVQLYPTSYDYNGSYRQPSAAVKLGTKALVQNRDYKLVYENNLNAGTAKVKVVGIGDYAGTIEKTFIINQKSLSAYDAAATLSSDTVLYDGKKAEPAVTVTCGGRTLVKNVDYTVSYYNNDKIGTATLYIYGKGNYTGSITKTFRIVGKDLSSLSATLSQTTYNYTGLEHKPAVIIYDGYKKLTSGTDYTVAYKDNKNCGTATVTITGKGNYSGTKTLTFTIVGKDQSITTNYTYYTKYLTSSAFNLGAKTDGDGVIVYESSDPSVATVSSTGTVTVHGTGVAYITVKTTKDVKYNPASKVVTVTVKPKKPAFKVTSPAKGQVKVTITKVDGATKYQVRYGRMGSYSNRYITHNDNGYSTTYVTLKNLKPGTNYFVKVRSYKKLADGTIVWGNWTVIKKIKTK